MAYIVLSLILLIAIILQTTIFSIFSLGQATPNLVLLLVIVFGIWGGRRWGIVTGIMAGLASDLLSGSLGSVTIISMPFVGFLSGLVGERTFRESLFIFILCTIGGTLLIGSVDLLVLNIFGLHIPLLAGSVGIMPYQVANNALAGLIFYKILYCVFVYIDKSTTGESLDNV